MKKNKLILFDWGNIVESNMTGYTGNQAWNDLIKRCGYEGNDNIYKQLSKYHLTAIKNEEEFKIVYEDMKLDFNLKVDYDEFVRLYKEILDKIDYYSEVADYEKSLGNRCYIGILSNLLIYDKERLDKQVDLSKYDYEFLSFEMGCRKPDLEIYEKVQSMVPFNKEDILFFDDKLSNIEAAKKFGWNAYQVTGLELDRIKEVCDSFLSDNN